MPMRWVFPVFDTQQFGISPYTIAVSLLIFDSNSNSGRYPPPSTRRGVAKMA
jgi:hypothetical protein